MKILEVSASHNPVFFSALTRAVQQIPQAKAPGPQWANMIANLTQKGVKQAEIQWSGILEWLQEQPVITKNQILQYLQQNEVQVQHIVHGMSKDNISPDEQATRDYGPAWDAIVQKLRPLRQAHSDALLNALYDKGPAEVPDDREITALEKQLDDLHARMIADTMKRQGYSGKGPQYKEYGLPGGTDYREMLLTTPPKQHELKLGTPESKTYRWQGREIVEGVIEYQFNIGDHTGTISYWPVTYNWKGEPKNPEWIVNSTFLQNGHFKSLEDAKAAILQTYNQSGADQSYAGRKDIYRARHWAGTPNVLAHVRFDTRTDSEGKKALHVLEVQSDWHQEGRRKGYQGDPVKAPELTWRPSKNTQNPTAVRVLGDQIRNMLIGYDPNGTAIGNVEYQPGGHSDGDWEAYVQKKGTIGYFQTEDEAKQAVANAVAEGEKAKQVPSGPFKKEWPLLAMRRILRYAAENGFDRVTWDMGETAVNRFDLSTRIGRIEYDLKPEKLRAWEPGKRTKKPVIDKEPVSPDELPDYIGKELADKLMSNPTDVIQNSEYFGNTHVISGVDIKVGGEGMKVFYDQILPAMMNKFAKKFGAKVFQTKISAKKKPEQKVPGWVPAWGIDITPQMQQSILYGMPLWEQQFNPSH